ncbi:MAG: hypothetical protein FWF31_09850 [Desulfobulbus sp.]|nr:hypothetical protein [Desulfobulbus sp.]
MDTLAIILSALAAAAAIWSVVGLFHPQALYFALTENQTRTNGFFFPLRIAIPFAILAYMETDLMHCIGHNWAATFGISLPFLWYAAKRAAVLSGSLFGDL